MKSDIFDLYEEPRLEDIFLVQSQAHHGFLDLDQKDIFCDMPLFAHQQSEQIKNISKAKKIKKAKSITHTKDKKDKKKLSQKTNQSLRESKQNKKCRNGHWSAQENKKYYLFLQIHSQNFLQKELRRIDKIFKSMEIFIETRQAQQCRSHHQKMQKKYGSFLDIIKNLRINYYGCLELDGFFQVINGVKINLSELSKIKGQLFMEKDGTTLKEISETQEDESKQKRFVDPFEQIMQEDDNIHNLVQLKPS